MPFGDHDGSLLRQQPGALLLATGAGVLAWSDKYNMPACTPHVDVTVSVSMTINKLIT